MGLVQKFILMKILITGSNGFLGKIIYTYLSNDNIHEIFTLSRSNSDYNFDLTKDSITFHKKFDLVIHCAGFAHIQTAKNSEIDCFFKVNVEGTLNLLSGLSFNQAPKGFILISTVSVYGLIVGENINEDFSLHANNPYGKSKMEAEFVVRKWCEENNIVCTILRLPLVVGFNPPGNLGAMIKGIQKGIYFNIAGGSAKKSMVLASDIAKYILKASEIGGIFNLTDGYHPSFFELSENISCQLGKSRSKNLPFWLAKVLARIGDFFGVKALLNSDKLCKITSDLTFDDTKAREAFGWDPTPVLNGFKISDTD